MSPQRNLLSSNAPNDVSNGASRANGEQRGAQGSVEGGNPIDGSRTLNPQQPSSHGMLPIWLKRFELFLRVVVRLYVGVLVLLLPWTHYWDDNRLLNMYSWLPDLALNGVARGIVSGLGLLNLWIAISDAIHYRES